MEKESYKLRQVKNTATRRRATADFVLRKYEILTGLTYTDDEIGIPILSPIDDVDKYINMIAFSKAVNSKNYNLMVHFYESDRSFARILHDPRKYSKILSRFRYVLSPDFSQFMDLPSFVRFQNSWWNKAMGAYWQSLGISVIPNVTWSTPDSYKYAFKGIPKESVIAINSTAIKGNALSKFLWRKGYETALNILCPKLIIRYGDMIEGEDRERSIYFENENLIRLRNGS